MVIRLENVELSYRTGDEPLRVLDIPSWTLGEGERVAVSGPSGCGKSTMLNIIAGLQSADGGTVEVCGERLDKIGEAARDRFRARHLGYIFQSFNLLQGFSALENVLLAMTFSGKKTDVKLAKDLLDEVGLSARMKHYPAQLSIGEQQRVAVARALANKPDLVLADEPTGSLDPKNSAEVVRLLRETTAGHGCSLVVVSHEQEVASAFDRQVPFLEINRAFEEAGGAR
jgi:putative ABC transport system ATP-binding protein